VIGTIREPSAWPRLASAYAAAGYVVEPARIQPPAPGAP